MLNVWFTSTTKQSMLVLQTTGQDRKHKTCWKNLTTFGIVTHEEIQIWSVYICSDRKSPLQLNAQIRSIVSNFIFVQTLQGICKRPNCPATFQQKLNAMCFTTNGTFRVHSRTG